MKFSFLVCPTLLLVSIVPPSAAQSSNNPTYSSAIYVNEDPQLKLLHFESLINDSSDPTKRIVYLPDAAKAALEAGDNIKAKAYATEGLTLVNARADDRMKRYNRPRQALDLGYADFYCNFVLGRLAILQGDVRAAESFLLVAGRTAGSPSLNSYGPNLSLVLEILKNGDSTSWNSVLAFFEETRSFWKIDPAVINQWVADIGTGKIPDFKQQIYY